MSKTALVTSIYKPFWGTQYFEHSVKEAGFPLYNAFKGKRFTGNGDVFKMLYDKYVELQNEYDYLIYSDGADSLVLRNFTPPDKVIYSAEMACYPHTYMADKYKDKKTQWCYLNGGGYCGPSKLIVEFFDRYGVNKYKGDINGQHEQMVAYLQAKDEGFPIDLDQSCEIFQTLAFVPETFFSVDDSGIFNPTTNTYPHVLHGNGRTDMSWLYKLYDK